MLSPGRNSTQTSSHSPFPQQPTAPVCSQALSRVRLFATPWTVAHKAPLSVGFSRQECWGGLPSPLPGPPSDPGITPASLVPLPWQAGSFPLSRLGSPRPRQPDPASCLRASPVLGVSCQWSPTAAALCDWLLSFCVMLLRSVRIVAWTGALLLRVNDIVSWIDHVSFLRL